MILLILIGIDVEILINFHMCFIAYPRLLFNVQDTVFNSVKLKKKGFFYLRDKRKCWYK